MKRASKRRGQTLIETTMATALTTTVFLVGVSTFLFGMSSWYRGEARISTETGTEQAVRRIAMALRQAMSVTVDADGKGLSYRLPQLDGGGTFVNPATWDGVNRRIELNGTNLVEKAAGQPDQTLCPNVVTTDPSSPNGTGHYTIFTPGTGTITRSLTVMVVSNKSAYNITGGVYGRRRETIFLRNIPQLSQ